LGFLLAIALAAAFIAERIAPWYEEWNQPQGDEAASVAHFFVYEANNVVATLLLPLIAWLSPWDGLWPQAWPLWAQFIGVILFADFVLMFLHYLSHRYMILWRLHAVHHGVGRLYGFNGLVRHYFLRRGPNVADVQVNLVPKGERDAQSHDIAKRVRRDLDDLDDDGRAGLRRRLENEHGLLYYAGFQESGPAGTRTATLS
jgi:hypothetical protein